MSTPDPDFVVIATSLWEEVCPGGRPPTLVTTLKPPGRKSAVFRLVGAAPDGAAVVAKRACRSTIDKEDRVYVKLMTRLSLPVARYYGSADDQDAGQRWLFLEDVGEIEWSPEIPEHRQLASDWFGRAHLAATDLLGEVELPVWGSHQYRELVRAARQTLISSLGNCALGPEDRRLLRCLEADCALLDTRWNVVQSAFACTPTTLAVPGFARKNARVRVTSSGNELLPFDFETVGWGQPTIEIRDLDIGAYWRLVGEPWGIDRGQTQLLATLGRALYALKSIPGEARTLASPWPRRSIHKISCYVADLTRAIQEFGLSPNGHINHGQR